MRCSLVRTLSRADIVCIDGAHDVSANDPAFAGLYLPVGRPNVLRKWYPDLARFHRPSDAGFKEMVYHEMEMLLTDFQIEPQVGTF